jgi:hypothetical protein
MPRAERARRAAALRAVAAEGDPATWLTRQVQVGSALCREGYEAP